jgi:accessory gene regulator protein AgrB
MLTKMKSWLKMKTHNYHPENGMLIALAVIIVLVIGPFVWKAIQGGYDTILARFTKASSNADVDSWNKK